MEIAITYITLGILYTIACVMDGSDVKPLWKKWLGVKLAALADYYDPEFCRKVDKCPYPKKYLAAKEDIRLLKAELNSYRNKPCIPLELQETRFDNVKLESNICISESDVFEAMREMEMARMYGISHMIPAWRIVDGLVERCKQNVVNGIFETIKRENLVNIEVDKESRRPAIIVRGWLYVGRKRT